MNDKVYFKILKEISKEQGYSITRVIDGVFELKKGNKKLYIRGKNFGLNSSLASSFAINKAHTYEILRRNNVEAVPHYELYQPYRYLVFGDQEKRNKKRIDAVIKKEKLPLVIKPATGFGSNDVSLCASKRQINKTMSDLFIHECEVVLCPFRKIEHEYRTVFLNGKVELIFDKVIPVRVKRNKLMHNVTPVIISNTEQIYKKLERISKRAAKILGLDFATVDIIETEDGKLEVLEVNSSVCLGKFAAKNKEHYEIAKTIYKKAWKKALK